MIYLLFVMLNHNSTLASAAKAFRGFDSDSMTLGGTGDFKTMRPSTESKLRQALGEAEAAFEKSKLLPIVRYADTVANTRGQLRPGGKPFTEDAALLRIIELNFARDFFNLHASVR